MTQELTGKTSASFFQPKWLEDLSLYQYEGPIVRDKSSRTADQALPLHREDQTLYCMLVIHNHHPIPNKLIS